MAMSANACVGLTDVDDLPLVEMAPRRAGEMLAVFVSGDGGWRAIDQRVAEQLHARGSASSDSFLRGFSLERERLKSRRARSSGSWSTT
jgi:hypothetical protein